ncbi:MAG: HAMP domain-containing histidine kinase [Bacteroidetes bacterium]|nr:HAMP domain-containing histidine kinase [Bacteroidota bacterium]
MTYRRIQWDILTRVLLLLLTLCAAAFLLVKQWYVYEILVLPVIIYQVFDFYSYHKQAQREVEQFVESIHYRDFSRNFNVTQAPEDLEVGINTIKRRSEGLLKFAEVYRNLNKITNPTLKHVFVRELFGNMHNLMQPTLNQKGIEMEVILKDPDLAVEVDANLVEQVLINLIVNAIEAVKESEHPRIVLSTLQSSKHKLAIKVSDNGYGMSEEVMNNIFIPFFSTKKNGSGIGLSLCKQIMMLHKGNITVQSVEGKGSVFTLQF